MAEPTAPPAPPPDRPWRERIGRATGGRLRVGRAIGVALSVWFRTLPQLLLVAVVIHSPLLAWQFSRLDEPETTDRRLADVLEGQMVASLATLLLSMVVQGILIHIVIQALRRQPISLAAAFRVGLSRLPVLIGVGIVVGLTAAVFLVPAVVLAIVMHQYAVLLYVLALVPLSRWYVAPSATVIERAGVGRSLSRASQLTTGNRWRIAGIVVLQYVVSGSVGYVTGFLSLRSPGAEFAVSELATLLASTLTSVLPVVVYQELRLTKEGVELDELASVFD